MARQISDICFRFASPNLTIFTRHTVSYQDKHPAHHQGLLHSSLLLFLLLLLLFFFCKISWFFFFFLKNSYTYVCVCLTIQSFFFFLKGGRGDSLSLSLSLFILEFVSWGPHTCVWPLLSLFPSWRPDPLTWPSAPPQSIENTACKNIYLHQREKQWISIKTC